MGGPARGASLLHAAPRLGVLALLLPGLLACGKRGDPLPPRRRIPAPVTGLSLAQRGARIEIAFQAPGASTDGARLPAIEMEVLVAQGDGDFEKLAARRTRRAQPGETVVEAVPVPAPSTTVRVAVRARAGSRSSVRTPVAGLVAQVPPAAPRTLTAELVPQGVALGWKGPRPEPVKAALPTPAPAGPAAAPSAPASAPTGPLPPPTAPGDEAVEAPAAAPPFPGGFSIYRRSADGVYTRPLGPPVEGKAFTDTTAPLGQEVCYQVRAVASLEPLVESDPTEQACVKVRDVAAPGPPTGVTVLLAEGGLEVSWSPSAESDLAGYRVLRASGDGPAEPLAEVAPNQTQYVDTGAVQGVAYSYRLVAFDQAGNVSPPSEPVEGVRP